MGSIAETGRSIGKIIRREVVLFVAPLLDKDLKTTSENSHFTMSGPRKRVERMIDLAGYDPLEQDGYAELGGQVSLRFEK